VSQEAYMSGTVLPAVGARGGMRVRGRFRTARDLPWEAEGVDGGHGEASVEG
jgi:hypothetical protein